MKLNQAGLTDQFTLLGGSESISALGLSERVRLPIRRMSVPLDIADTPVSPLGTSEQDFLPEKGPS
jgi:hypothetical protein